MQYSKRLENKPVLSGNSDGHYLRMGVCTSILVCPSSFNLPATELKQTLGLISGFRRHANEICALWRFNAAQQGSYVPISWRAYRSHLQESSLNLYDGTDTFSKNARTELPSCTALKSPKERRCQNVSLWINKYVAR